MIQPRLLAAGFPPAFDNLDDELDPDLSEPRIADDLATLSLGEQAVVREFHCRRIVFWAYHVFNGHLNQNHIAAIRDPLLRDRQILVDKAGRRWDGNLVTLRGFVMAAAQFWEHLPDVDGIKCPVEFTETERDEHAKQEEGWSTMNILIEQWRRRCCNMTEEVWVRNEDYEEAKTQFEEFREEFQLQCEGYEEDMHALQTGWPYRDRRG